MAEKAIWPIKVIDITVMSQFCKNIIRMGGEQGKVWLDALPSLVATLSQQWNLCELVPLSNLSYNYVMQGRRRGDGTHIVLKLGFCQKDVAQEIQALKMYNGQGCVNLLAYDLDRVALLLERVMPGETLKTLFPADDDRAVEYVSDVIERLHQQPVIDASLFPTIEQWLIALQGQQSNVLFKYHAQRAGAIASELLASQSSFVLLHGDLHHENVLSSTRDGWLAIDPKGWIGDPACDVGAFIRNPMPDLLSQTDAVKIVARRFDIFSQRLGIDRERLVAWSYVQAVLAACWAIEDHGSWHYLISCAQLIERV